MSWSDAGGLDAGGLDAGGLDEYGTNHPGLVIGEVLAGGDFISHLPPDSDSTGVK